MEHAIRTVEELRDVIGPSSDAVRVKVADTLERPALAFLADAPFCVLATADDEGRVDASPKGDAPGFVLVEDERTLVVPDRPGNKLAMGLENILANPQVGLIFLIPGTTQTLRINGRAELSRDPDLLERMAARGKPAVLAIRVHIEECFFHCSKAFIRSQLWKPETWPERAPISFGKMYAERTGGDEALAAVVDELVAEDERVNL